MTVRLLKAFLLLGALVTAPSVAAQTAPPAPDAAASFGERGLHFTARGLVYSYERGLKKLTGLPADRIGCTKATCHASSCDTCHKTEIEGKVVYSTAFARSGKPCQSCHGAPDPKDTDVHVRAGMGCMDCHTSRDIHGDGTRYDSAWQKGAMDVRCERCHKDVTQSASHTAHHGRVDCSACHTRETPTCFNCHIESRLAGAKETSITRAGLTFLINHDGRVKPGNVLTYVYGNGTAITVAPTYPHKITRQGRTCAECHATRIAKDVAAGTLTLTRFENGGLASIRGVVPVVDPSAWRLAFLGREQGRWIPLTSPRPPIVSFSGFASPLTKEQLAELVKEEK